MGLSLVERFFDQPELPLEGRVVFQAQNGTTNGDVDRVMEQTAPRPVGKFKTQDATLPRSPRTVEKHVGQILHKLGVGTFSRESPTTQGYFNPLTRRRF